MRCSGVARRCREFAQKSTQYCHNLAQVLVAILLLDTPEIGYYAIVLTVTGTISGVFVGLCAGMLVSRIPRQRVIK